MNIDPGTVLRTFSPELTGLPHVISITIIAWNHIHSCLRGSRGCRTTFVAKESRT